MADKSVGELIAAQSVTPTDLFVLEQNGTAKKLFGQDLINFLLKMLDGHGGIQNITKVSSSGLTDTYSIAFADLSTTNFTITNGRSITKIAKTKTSGLVDTYTITYNDGTTSTFKVTNGEQGPQGVQAFVHIKYASQMPTDVSDDMGDIPDKYMGIYSGTSASAPTDYKAYSWYRIEGEQGDTGDPATVKSSEVRYQMAESGTVMPSGSWLTNPPAVTQGKYLWTRTTVAFNSGDPIVYYSVSYMGVDGVVSFEELSDEQKASLKGEDGKSAYQTALDGGYLGTEEEFAAKLAVEYIDWFGNGISIPSGSDLDTYTTNGKYNCNSENIAQSLLNCPTSTNFVMFTFLRTQSAMSQLIIALNGKMYIRSRSSSAWRSWIAYTTSEEITELTTSVKKELQDSIKVPTKTSELENDSGFLTKDDDVGGPDWFGKGKSIPNGSNIDAYTTPGKYYVSSTTAAGTMQNGPVSDDNYVLYVFKRTDGSSTGASINQMAITMNSELYIRGTNSSGVWREWKAKANVNTVEEMISDAISDLKDSGELTPVRGVDYWTEADQESIVQQVITALGTPVFGTVDENNVITLTGDLKTGTYTLKYEGSDGSKVNIGTVKIGEVINQIPISTDASGAVFNGVGYQSGYRINSSGNVVEQTGQNITGFIPCKNTDIVRFTPDMFTTTDQNLAGYNAIAVYKADRTFIANVYVPNNDKGGIEQESENVWVFKPSSLSSLSSMGYIRFCMSRISGDSIVTVNQKIS